MAIETILVAVGRGDDEAARIETMDDAIVDLAIPTGAEVILLHVFGEDHYDHLVEQLDFDSPGDATPDSVARRHNATRELGKQLESDRVEFSVRGEVHDDPGSGVVAAAEQVGADLIIVGGRKRSPTGKAVFGSTAQQVMLNADCPVTYVRSD